MTTRLVELHPSVVARFQRAFPHASLDRFVAQAMTDAVKQHDADQESERWAKLGLAGRDRSAS